MEKLMNNANLNIHLSFKHEVYVKYMIFSVLFCCSVVVVVVVVTTMRPLPVVYLRHKTTLTAIIKQTHLPIHTGRKAWS